MTVNARICAETALLHRSPSPRGERLRLERPAIHRQAHGSTAAGCAWVSCVILDDRLDRGRDKHWGGELPTELLLAVDELGASSHENDQVYLSVVLAQANRGVFVGQGDVPDFAEPTFDVGAPIGNLNESSGIEDFFYVASGFGHAENATACKYTCQYTRGVGVTVELTAPFPYFGGKRRAAPMIWDALGDPGGYVEPCGACQRAQEVAR